MPSGWYMVPITAIDQSENPISGASDFSKGYSIEDLEHAFNLLDQEVLPALASGADEDFLAAKDNEDRTWGTRSLSMTFRDFLQDKAESIRLAMRPDGACSISNGRHRVWVATRMGRTHVPAFIEGAGDNGSDG